MPGPWRLVEPSGTHGGMFDFNLRRDARPLATTILKSRCSCFARFQSQTRCQAPGDGHPCGRCPPCAGFQSQTRCQAPGDQYPQVCPAVPSSISISDEKPGPWRLGWRIPAHKNYSNFNLRREARPLATSCICKSKVLIPVFQSQTRSQAPGDSVLFAVALASFSISISDEKPGPWRRRDFVTVPILPYIFQSQTRSQAPGDYNAFTRSLLCWFISISDEKPGPWRRMFQLISFLLVSNFNLRREARPLATLSAMWQAQRSG